MFLKRIVQKVRSCGSVLSGNGRASFAQAGEDRILDYFFTVRGIAKPTYLDIGANHPVRGNNTYFFYLRGSNGVCIEPNPALFQVIKKTRPRDIVLNVGIGLNQTEAADFYTFESPYTGWNSFSKTEADERVAEGVPIKEVLQIPLRNVNDILKEQFESVPDFISIDVEGLDFEILQSLDFERFAPLILLVETLFPKSRNAYAKNTEVIDFVCSKGYTVYADTCINTIFLRS